MEGHLFAAAESPGAQLAMIEHERQHLREQRAIVEKDLRRCRRALDLRRSPVAALPKIEAELRADQEAIAAIDRRFGELRIERTQLLRQLEDGFTKHFRAVVREHVGHDLYEQFIATAQQRSNHPPQYK